MTVIKRLYYTHSIPLWFIFTFSFGSCLSDDVTGDDLSYLSSEDTLIYEEMESAGFTKKLRQQITGKTKHFTDFSQADQVAANRWLCQAADDEQHGDLSRPSCRNRPEVFQFQSAGDLSNLNSYAEAMRSVFRQPKLINIDGSRGIVQLIKANFSDPVRAPPPKVDPKHLISV